MLNAWRAHAAQSSLISYTIIYIETIYRDDRGLKMSLDTDRRVKAKSNMTFENDQSDLVNSTAWASVYVQLVSLAVSVAGFVPIAIGDVSAKSALFVVLILEVSVQVIELSWYLYFMIQGMALKVANRYYDWFFSTPTMLLSLIFTLEYFKDTGATASAVMESHLGSTLAIIFLNWGMLICGYMYVLYPSIKWLVPLGFIPFTFTFALLFSVHARHTDLGVILWVYTTVCWAGYGVAAVFSERNREVTFNILDIFSKNVFGIMVVFIMLL